MSIAVRIAAAQPPARYYGSMQRPEQAPVQGSSVAALRRARGEPEDPDNSLGGICAQLLCCTGYWLRRMVRCGKEEDLWPSDTAPKDVPSTPVAPIIRNASAGPSTPVAYTKPLPMRPRPRDLDAPKAHHRTERAAIPSHRRQAGGTAAHHARYRSDEPVGHLEP